jgi:hypothetical protein
MVADVFMVESIAFPLPHFSGSDNGDIDSMQLI